MTEFKIDGSIYTEKNISLQELQDIFINAIESAELYFGGSMSE